MSSPIDSSLIPFFEPQGIVLVGASRNPMKLGFGLARNLVQSGYAGAIHFVNPGGGMVRSPWMFGRAWWNDLSADFAD